MTTLATTSTTNATSDLHDPHAALDRGMRRSQRSAAFRWLVVGAIAASTSIVATPALLAQESSNATEPAVGGAAVAPDAVADAPASAEATSAPAPKLHEVIAASKPEVQVFNEHLMVLASPWMEGRLPGTPGMERAMDYMEHHFRLAGLEPGYQPSGGGPKSYRQPFPLGGKREVVEESIVLRCGEGEKALVAGTDFRLSSLGRSGVAEGVLAFVGYGIDDGPDGYSSFAEDHSLEGKIALVLRFEPMDEKGNSLWSGGEGWSGRGGFAGKIAAVARRKPAAILVANTPGANDPRISSLSTGGGRPMTDVPVFMLSTAAAEELVTRCGRESLLELRALADRPKEGVAPSFDLAGPDGTARVAIAGRVEEKPVIAENVVGVLPGRGELAKEVIVIGGHLDHLGMGDFGSREGPGKLHPGADDNASGSAGVIMLGDMLKRLYDAEPATVPLRTLVFVGFSAEESGLNGSRHYVNEPIYPIKDTVLMMNFDMIGRIKDERLSVTYTPEAKGMKEWAQPFFASSGLKVIESTGRGGGGSDHASFQAVGVPILFAIIADFHDDYHTSRDTLDLIDRESSVRAVELWRELAFDMAKRPARFEIDQNVGPMRAQPMRVRAGLRTRELDDGSGLEVVEVTKDGSADKAGILKGDRIVKWNKKEMKDRAAFVEDLRSHEPGATVQAVVIRDGQEITFFVELQAARAAQP